MTPKHLADFVAPLDALLLKGDADPATRAIMTMALVLAAPPDVARLHEAFEHATRAVPRMRQRVGRSSWTMRQSEWVNDDHFDLAYHVRFIGAPGDRSLQAALAMASNGATAPFDSARPLWEAVLVKGLEDGRAVLLLRAHHAIADGVRAIHMLANLLDLEPNPAKGDVQEREELPATRNSKFARGLARGTSHAVVTNQRRAELLAQATVNTAIRPVGVVTDGATYAKSALRTFDRGQAEPSPLLRSRSRGRKFGTLEIPLDSMREAAKANAATVNDVFLAGLLGGFGKYHVALGQQCQDVPISFPIDVSGDEGQASGNHFSAAVIPGPASVMDPEERVRQVHALVTSRRSEPGVDAVVRLAPLLHHVPSWLAAAGMAAYSRRVDLQASNVVGPDFPMYLAGTKVDRFYAFGPLPGVPVMVVLVSYEGVCSLGFTIDPAAVAESALFLTCMREAFDELVGGQSRVIAT
jgi:diacylglycerol O-acyltransferase